MGIRDCAKKECQEEASVDEAVGQESYVCCLIFIILLFCSVLVV